MALTLLSWLTGEFFIESGRLERSKNIIIRKVQEDDTGSSYKLEGDAKSYHVSFSIAPSISTSEAVVEASCDCADWTTSLGNQQGRLCKHLIALAKQAETPNAFPAWAEGMTPKRIISDTPPATAPAAAPVAATSFRDKLGAAITAAIEDLADQVLAALQDGQVPLLVGPTGCGKTSAIRIAALKLGCLLVEHAGSDSWSDSDLVGVTMPTGLKFPGPVAKALGYAREMSEPVLLFLDEFTRYNPRAQEANMRLFLPTNAATAAAMNIPHNGAVRITSAPFWGDEWAPAENIHIAAACNPWGNAIDPALVRRTVPVFVDFDNRVKACFTGTLANAIEISWKGTRDGSLPLPLEYGELSRAESPNDTAVLARYTARLRAVDASSAEAFSALVKGTTP